MDLGRLFGAISPTAQGATSMLKKVRQPNRDPASVASNKQGYAEIWHNAAQNDLAASLEQYDRLVCKLRSAAAQAEGPRKIELLEALGKYDASPLAYLGPVAAVPCTTGTRAPASSGPKKAATPTVDPSTEGVLAEFRQDASRICEEFGAALGFKTHPRTPAIGRASQSSKRPVEKVVVPSLDLSQVHRHISEDESE